MVTPSKPVNPIGHFDADSGLWVLSVRWQCELSGGLVLDVSPGARSDGASIPWLFRPFVGPRYNARTFPGAFAHDMLYAAELLPRAQCDREFRRIVKMFTHDRLASAYYYGVRVGGWYVWMRHKRDQVLAARRFCRVVNPAAVGQS